MGKGNKRKKKKEKRRRNKESSWKAKGAEEREKKWCVVVRRKVPVRRCGFWEYGFPSANAWGTKERKREEKRRKSRPRSLVREVQSESDQGEKSVRRKKKKEMLCHS